MKKQFLFFVVFLCISVLGFSQEKTTKENNGVFSVRLEAGAYFLQNNQIKDIYRTTSFPTLGIGIELGNQNIQAVIDFYTTLPTQVDLDEARFTQNSASFSQRSFALGLLQRLPISSQVYFRGRFGINFTTTNEDILKLNDRFVFGGQVGAGLEFQTFSAFRYFIDLNYQLQQVDKVGGLGGFRLTLGILIGGKSSK